MTTPRVALIVIALNEVENAPRCFRSILAQDETVPFEAILVDDGSTDATAEAVEVEVNGDPRVRIVRLLENRGRGAARAAGIAATDAEIVGFVDADITLPLDWLRRCLEMLPGHAAVGGVAVPDGDATVIARITGATPRPVAGSAAITGNNVLFDARVFREFGFDPRDHLGEDFRLANRLQRAGHSLARVPGLNVRHEESKSYLQGLRWRYANGVDASSHPRELGRVRFADLVWAGFVGAWVVAVVGAVVADARWLLIGLVASIAPGVSHSVSRYRPRPVGRFLLACILDVPFLFAYLVGRTVGAPRLIRGRR